MDAGKTRVRTGMNSSTVVPSGRKRRPSDAAARSRGKRVGPDRARRVPGSAIVRPLEPTAKWSARRWAVELLVRSEGGTEFGSALLAQVSPDLSSADRALVTELFYGVLRHRSALDWRLAACSQRPLARLAAPVRATLRLAAYQLLFLSRIPTPAAVHTSVELVKSLGSPTDAGFVNAVLRALDQRRDTLVVPDLLERPLDHLTAEYSHPVWLVRRWLKRFGLQRTLQLCRADNAVPPTTLRVNTLVTTRERVLDALREEGIDASPSMVSPCGVVMRSGSPTAPRAFAQGWYYVQDEAAQLVSLAVAPRPGERILDACAAPGGKSIHLAELMGDQGEIIAADVDPGRLRLVAENCRRMAVTSVRPVLADMTSAADVKDLGKFDRILVDAPCSGLGVLRRHPEAKWHKTEALIARYAATQRTILERVSTLLKPGGVLVYSTCSTEREENEGLVGAWALARRSWSRDDLRSVLPGSARTLITPEGYLSTLGNRWDMDHFFAARFTNPGAA